MWCFLVSYIFLDLKICPCSYSACTPVNLSFDELFFMCTHGGAFETLV